MLVQIEENSATLTPFGSLIRISPVKVSRGKSLTAKLRAMLALLFQRLPASRFERRKYLRRNKP